MVSIDAGNQPFYETAQLVSVSRRVLARAVDLAFVIPIVAPASVLYLVRSNGKSTHLELVTDLAIIAAWIGAAAYEIVFIALRGQTPGKKVFDVRVVKAIDGRLPGWERSLGRFALPATFTSLSGIVHAEPWSTLTVMVALVVYLFALGDRYRQGLHDRAAGTIVVRASQERPVTRRER